MPDVCVVVPCYNEARRLPAAHFESYLTTHPHVHVCFVDDGSRDETREVLDALRRRLPSQMTILGDGVNEGKGQAVRRGILHALSHSDAPIVGYWDADLATPLPELDTLVAACAGAPERLGAIGSRVKRLGADIARRPVRHVLGRVFATFASLVLDLPVYDTQCGAKVLNRDAAAVGFREPFVTSWLFDVEVLARLRNHYGTDAAARRILEVPLGAWADVDGSNLGVGTFVRAPLDLWRIARAYRRRYL